MVSNELIKDKIKGCIYGQAIGDALGVGTEFMTAELVKKNYPKGLKYFHQIIDDDHASLFNKGGWSDDTDMFLCIADAREDNHFNINKIAENFKAWYQTNPKDIGNYTAKVLGMRDYVNDPILWSEVTYNLYGSRDAANGGLMRTSILGTSPEVQDKEIEDVCRMTHPDKRCLGSCVILVKLIQNLIFHNYQMQYQELISIAKSYDKRIEEYIHLSLIDISKLKVDGEDKGYTLITLAVALWTLWHCNSFEEGLLTVVNLGGDADTNAAVACSLLGAKYGYSSIPNYYKENILDSNILEGVYSSAIKDLHL